MPVVLSLMKEKQMFDRFTKAVEQLSRLGIEPHELIIIGLHSDEVTCQLREEAFARIAKQLFVLELNHHESAPEHLRFSVHGIEFVTVSYESAWRSQFRIVPKTAMGLCGL